MNYVLTVWRNERTGVSKETIFKLIYPPLLKNKKIPGLSIMAAVELVREI